ncbi:MAG: hypothetical protein ACR2JU_12425 [Nocardioidaceae bacterium]
MAIFDWPKIGGWLMGTTFTAALTYLLTMAASSKSLPVWPYFVIGGMFVIGGGMWIVGRRAKRNSAPQSHRGATSVHGGSIADNSEFHLDTTADTAYENTDIGGSARVWTKHDPRPSERTELDYADGPEGEKSTRPGEDRADTGDGTG